MTHPINVCWSACFNWIFSSNNEPLLTRWECVQRSERPKNTSMVQNFVRQVSWHWWHFMEKKEGETDYL